MKRSIFHRHIFIIIVVIVNFNENFCETITTVSPCVPIDNAFKQITDNGELVSFFFSIFQSKNLFSDNLLISKKYMNI